MSEALDRYPRLRMVSADLLSAHAGITPEAAALAGAAATAPEAVDALRDAGVDGDLARMLPFMLPKREAVWLACLWARTTEFRAPSPPATRALRCAEAWVRDQGEDARYRAFEEASGEQFDGPGAWAGIAAFWSGPSLAPRDLEPVPPANHLTGVAAVCVLTMATVDPALKPMEAAKFADLGLEVASGRNGVDLLRALRDGETPPAAGPA